MCFLLQNDRGRTLFNIIYVYEVWGVRHPVEFSDIDFSTVPSSGLAARRTNQLNAKHSSSSLRDETRLDFFQYAFGTLARRLLFSFFFLFSIGVIQQRALRECAESAYRPTLRQVTQNCIT